MNLEVLVATMNRNDLSLHTEMNIKRDVIIANQCGKWDYTEQDFPYGKARMISSDTIGVGKNRNIGMSIATGDIILFADDDIVYYDSEIKGVVDAFEQLPDADIILFGIDMTKKGIVFDERREPIKRRQLWNAMRFGACRMAVRRESLQKAGVTFSTLFGGGCKYGSGEDTIFLRDCFRKGLKVYSHSYVLGACAKDSSTWFTGYNEKFFFDKGAFVACAFPKVTHIIKWYFIFKFSKRTDLKIDEVIKNFNKGISEFKGLKEKG